MHKGTNIVADGLGKLGTNGQPKRFIYVFELTKEVLGHYRLDRKVSIGSLLLMFFYFVMSPPNW